MSPSLFTFAPLLAAAVAAIYYISQRARLQDFGGERPPPPVYFPYRPYEDEDETRRRRDRAERDSSSFSQQMSPRLGRSRHGREDDFHNPCQDSSDAAFHDYFPQRQVYAKAEINPKGRNQEEVGDNSSTVHLCEPDCMGCPLESEKQFCVLCNENPRNAEILPCLHRDVCMDCILRMNRRGCRNCPLCRTTIQVVQLIAPCNALHGDFDQTGTFVDSLPRREIQNVDQVHSREIEQEMNILKQISTDSRDSSPADVRSHGQMDDVNSLDQTSTQALSSGDFPERQRSQVADEVCSKVSHTEQETSLYVLRSTHGNELLPQGHTMLHSCAQELHPSDYSLSNLEQDLDNTYQGAETPSPEYIPERPEFQGSGEARRRRRQSKKKRQRARRQSTQTSTSTSETQASTSTPKSDTSTSNLKPQTSTSTPESQTSTSTMKPQTSTRTSNPQTSIYSSEPQTSNDTPKPPLQDPEPELQECVLCYNNPSNVELLPCRHRSVCMDCVLSMTLTGNRDCPFCRGAISSFLRVAAQSPHEDHSLPQAVQEQQWSVWDDSEEEEESVDEGGQMDEQYILWFVLSCLAYLLLFCFMWRMGMVDEG